jgi:hypothetical protein
MSGSNYDQSDYPVQALGGNGRSSIPAKLMQESNSDNEIFRVQRERAAVLVSEENREIIRRASVSDKKPWWQRLFGR